MNVKITTDEKKQLTRFLDLAPIPEITLCYYELLGFLYGIAITPDLIPPGEWVPVIFGEDMPEYESETQAQIMMQTLFSVLDRHITAFRDDSLVMPFDMENLAETDIEHIWDWTSGFEEALALRPECWEEDQQDLSELEQDHLMYSLIVIEGVVNPDEAMDMFETLPRHELEQLGVPLGGSESERAMQVQIYLLQALELAVKTVQKHGLRLETKRQARIRSSSVPFARRSSRAAKNEKCPCGSHKIYKDCCGRKPWRDNSGLYEVKSKKGRGKLIRGEFPHHHGEAPTKLADGSSGLIYQLEVSLAYTEPQVMRRLRIPASMTLAELHMVIQLCMGWQNRHMHQFQVGEKFYGPLVADGYAETPMHDESHFRLRDIEKELLQGIVYIYDFGDNWEHVVLLEKVVPVGAGKPYPVLVEGSMACPPEDIGGVPGYQSLLDALAESQALDQTKPAHSPGVKDYDPAEVGKDAINALLQEVYGKK
jgi:yecA family protein